MSRSNILVLAVAGLSVWAIAIGPALAWSLRAGGPRNDFVTFYCAGGLLRSGGLYDAAMTGAAHASAGVIAEQHRMDFLRPPFYAWLLVPLGWPSYRASYAAWQVLSLAAFAVSAAMWGRMAGNRYWPAAAAWSLPMAFVLLRGQDTAFLLFGFTGAAWLMWRGRETAAGWVLACCLVKWSFCLAIPLVLLRRRMWKTLGAFAAGGAAAAAVSFAAAGAGWVSEYVTAILRPSAAPHQEQMISLNGLVSGAPEAIWLEALAAALVAACVWRAAGRGGPERALAAALFGGVLISHHAYLYDCVLLFPAALFAAADEGSPALRLAGVALLVPLFFAPLLFFPWSRIPQAGALLWLMLPAATAARAQRVSV